MISNYKKVASRQVLLMIVIAILFGCKNSSKRNLGTSKGSQDTSFTTSQGVIFKKVSDQKLGKMVWEDTREKGLAWGDVSSSWSSWEEAFDSCLKLNPKEHRDSIKAALKANRDISRGYFLPKMKDWDFLAQSMSSGTMNKATGAFPDYLEPELFQTNNDIYNSGQTDFWTSSISLDGRVGNDRNAWFFNSKEGRLGTTNIWISSMNKLNTKHFRCVRSGEAW